MGYPTTKVLVTQMVSSHDIQELQEMFPHLQLISLPLIKTLALPLITGDVACFQSSPLWDWIIFTSKTSVNILADTFPEFFSNLQKKTHLVAVGTQTKQALLNNGVKHVHIFTEVKTGEDLGRVLTQKFQLTNQNILYPRALKGKQEIINILQGSGATLTVVDLYDTVPDLSKAILLKNHLSRGIDWITFSSPSAVKSFIAMIPAENLKTNLRFASLGKSTTKAMNENGLKATVEAHSPSLRGLLGAIRLYLE